MRWGGEFVGATHASPLPGRLPVLLLRSHDDEVPAPEIVFVFTLFAPNREIPHGERPALFAQVLEEPRHLGHRNPLKVELQVDFNVALLLLPVHDLGGADLA